MGKNKFFQTRFLEYFLVGFAFLFLAGSLYLDIHQQQKVRLSRLRQQLAFGDLLALEEQSALMSPQQLIKYLSFYKDLIKHQGASADLLAMEGFCYYHLGEYDKAKAAYEQAVALNPHFFAFEYNLAVLNFERGDYEQAFIGFEKALATSLGDNVNFLRKSKNFVYIIYKLRLDDAALKERFKKGYSLSAYFACVCLQKSGNVKQALFFLEKSNRMYSLHKEPPMRLRVF